MNEEYQYRNHPLFKKGESIFYLIERISSIVDETTSNEEESLLLEQYISYLVENSLLITSKIIGILNEDMLYDLKMENATIIRKAAREILTDTSGLKLLGFKELDYLELVRNEIEELRILFAEWVKTFDSTHYIIDRWGLFNPPGVNYDDHDPDDDIDFKNPFLDDEI